MNIVYSSTRQWNPGDEFAFMGLRKLMDSVYGEHNVIMYNRHPYVIAKGRPQMPPIPVFFDNSWHPSDLPIDLIVMSGPEWGAGACDQIYSFSKKHSIPLMLIGVGASNQISSFMSNDLIKTVIARDSDAALTLRNLSPHILTCPAILAGGEPKIRFQKNKLAISFQGHGYCCAPSNHTYNKLLEIYRELNKQCDVTLCCHTYPDLVFAQKDLPEIKSFYSAFSADYIVFYQQFDAHIGTRLHGAILAAGMGIPSLVVNEDVRHGALPSINAGPIPVDKLIEEWGKLNIQESSQKLITHRYNTFNEYCKIISASMIL